MTTQIRLGLIGAGNRGNGIFGQFALDTPHRATFNLVVEPDESKRSNFAEKHRIPGERVFADLDAFVAANPDDLDGVVIATQEDHRYEPVQAAMDMGLHVLVEKPLCRTPEELVRFHDATKNYENIIVVCHQMRLTPLYKAIKDLIDSGDYGEIVAIQHSENLSYHHMAHSFVRGFFNHSDLSPMLLAKSCHDLDLITYLVGENTRKVSSFGSLSYFTEKNRPEGAPEFCLEGCPHRRQCPYDVLKLYFNDDTDPAYIRQMGVNLDRDKLMALMKRNRFGKCVFRAGNDVVDHQSVIVEYENDVTLSFTMCGHNGRERRMTKISMTNGEIEYDGTKNTIKTWTFEPLRSNVVTVCPRGTHSGGDVAIMENFIDAIETGDKSILITPIRDSFEGHLAVFAAEESRKSGETIITRDYENKLRASK